MKSVLGLPLDVGCGILEDEGYAVKTVEVSAKKRIDGGEARIIRQLSLDEKTVELAYSLFKTGLEG